MHHESYDGLSILNKGQRLPPVSPVSSTPFGLLLSMFSTLTAVGIILAFALGAWYSFGLGSRPKDYPPGPPTLPIVGNLHQVCGENLTKLTTLTSSKIPSKNEYLQFTKWAKEYGPIYSIMVGSRPVIVISSVDIVRDLFDKRGAIYSDRPEAYAAKHVPVSKLRMAFMVSELYSTETNVH